jgi:ankyrin repeat protein
VNDRDTEGHTPLMWAAFSGWDDMILLLVRNGGDAFMTDKDGRTALHWAAGAGALRHTGTLAAEADPGAGKLEVVKALLFVQGPMGLTLRDKLGQTALDYAAQGSDADTNAFLQTWTRQYPADFGIVSTVRHPPA